jgi:hypothetical protein
MQPFKKNCNFTAYMGTVTFLYVTISFHNSVFFPKLSVSCKGQIKGGRSSAFCQYNGDLTFCFVGLYADLYHIGGPANVCSINWWPSANNCGCENLQLLYIELGKNVAKCHKVIAKL